MQLYFYSRSSKPSCEQVDKKYAHLIYGDGRDEVEKFQDTGMTVADVDIFQSEVLENNHCLFEAGDEIAKLVQEHNSEAIIMCDADFFRDLVKVTEKDEMEPKILTTSYRGMLYYAAIGEDKCALLIAYDK